MRTFVLIAGVAGLLSAVSLHAEPAPTVQTLLAKHAEAVGPVDRIQTRRVKLRITGMAPFELPAVVEASRPNLIRKDVSIQGTPQVTAFDGKQAWKTDPFVAGGDKPAPLPAAEARQLQEEADFDGALVKPEAKGIRVAYVGPATLNGKNTYELRVTLPDGAVQNVWLDAATYLETKRTQTMPLGGTMQTVETWSSDYRAVQGVKLAYRLESGVAGAPQKATIVVDSVEFNPRIDKARFAQP